MFCCCCFLGVLFFCFLLLVCLFVFWGVFFAFFRHFSKNTRFRKFCCFSLYFLLLLLVQKLGQVELHHANNICFGKLKCNVSFTQDPTNLEFPDILMHKLIIVIMFYRVALIAAEELGHDVIISPLIDFLLIFFNSVIFFPQMERRELQVYLLLLFLALILYLYICLLYFLLFFSSKFIFK